METKSIRKVTGMWVLGPDFLDSIMGVVEVWKYDKICKLTAFRYSEKIGLHFGRWEVTWLKPAWAFKEGRALLACQKNSRELKRLLNGLLYDSNGEQATDIDEATAENIEAILKVA